MPKYSSDKVNAIQSKRKVSGGAAYVSVSGGDSAAGRTGDGPDNHWGSFSMRWGG